MADTGLQLGIVGAYMIIALAVGAVAYRLTDRTAEDYYLASRTLGTVVLLFTTFATLLSAFTFFGGPNLAFSAGPEWILVMGLMDGIIFAVLWYVLGYKQWLVGKRHGYVTLGEMLGDRFGSTALRVVVAGVSLVWLFPYVMLQQKGAGQAIVGLTNGAVPFWVGAGGITLFMIAYVALSGMRGVAWTDTLQGLFMLSLIWVAVAWVLSAVGGASEATALLASKEPAFVGLGGGLYTPQYIISTAVSIAFGVTMFPQINQRFFAAGSKKVLKRTFALWPVLVLLLFVPAFMLGAWAAGLGVTVPEGGNVIPALLGEYTPTWFTALVIAGAMAAMMSSSDSMLLSGSSYLTRDLYRPLTGRSNASDEATDRREALVARLGVIVFATLSFIASLYSPGTLVQIGETAFSGFAQLTLPVALALYWQGTTRTGMYAGVIGSQVFYGLHVFPVLSTLGGLVGISVALPTAYLGWTPGIVGIIVGLVLTVSVSLVTAPAATENHTVYAVSGVESD
ncbi:sodium:solute symporter [Haloarcula taiwanensis]|uniref:Sodium:solute symporter n=1 Tax=Haloarcula taiwanensis TaxID=1932004 RepID=A0A2H4ZZW0_9EURY|nr:MULTISPECIES: sodium:solute symporter family protein [Haloarcula]AUG48023.1 sodium:solute symporter [Haloarcula taiwanensis]RLM39380.1 sodium:solute symporter family protein [Haloarcula sp. Atlit-120R]RLM47278.1 sodium:solute symporter family protein [Haloarcula sp. Atlit-47R]